MAFSVHGAVLAAAAARAPAMLLIPDDADYHRSNDTHQYQRNGYSSEIVCEPCEHTTTPLRFHLNVVPEL